MEKIKAFNCTGMCMELHCSEPYTYLEEVNVKCLDVVIALCDRHARLWEGLCPDCGGNRRKNKGSFDKLSLIHI